jgi:hypothetical protein
MAEHPLCCECDACLNGTSGLVLEGAGKTKPDELASAAALVRQDELRRHRAIYARGRARRRNPEASRV